MQSEQGISTGGSQERRRVVAIEGVRHVGVVNSNYKIYYISSRALLRAASGMTADTEIGVKLDGN